MIIFFNSLCFYLSPSREALCINNNSASPSRSSFTQGRFKKSSIVSIVVAVLIEETRSSLFVCQRKIAATHALLGWLGGEGIWWDGWVCKWVPIYFNASFIYIYIYICQE